MTSGSWRSTPQPHLSGFYPKSRDNPNPDGISLDTLIFGQVRLGRVPGFCRDFGARLEHLQDFGGNLPWLAVPEHLSAKNIAYNAILDVYLKRNMIYCIPGA